MTGPCCEDPVRLQRVEEFNAARVAEGKPGLRLNAVEGVEVLDQGLPKPLRQRLLLVRCLLPVAGLGRANVVVAGGERIPDVGVEWAFPGSSFWAGDPPVAANPGVSASEATAVHAALDDAGGRDRVLVVRVAVPGDFSAYRLRVVREDSPDRPHAGFDERLHAARFSFKVDCPTGLDCRHEPRCAPEREEPVALDYLAKDYAGFRRLMLDRMALTAPQRQDSGPADLAVTLVEALAAAADHLSYRQDAVAVEAYPGTARLRTSLRRHLRLRDYRLHEGCNARVFVAFTVDRVPELALDPVTGDPVPGAPDAGVAIAGPDPAAGTPGTVLWTRLPGAAARVAGDDEARLGAAPHETFEAMHGLRCYAAHNRMRIHTWSERGCVLPVGTTRLTLRDDDPHNPLRLVPGDVVVLEEVRDSADGRSWDPDGPAPPPPGEHGDPTRRHAVRLTRVWPAATATPAGRAPPVRGPNGEPKDAIEGVPIVEVEWDAADALPFALCVSTVDGQGESIEDVTVARGNVVLADHGRTVDLGSLVTPEPDPEPCLRSPWRPELDATPLAHATPLPRGRRAASTSAAALLRQDPRHALAAVQVRQPGLPWSVRPDLLSSGAHDRDLVVEEEPRRNPRLRFGDGVNGREPAPGSPLSVRARTGAARRGNVGAGAIAHVVEPADALNALAAVQRVRNPLAAQGGTEPERMQRARLDAPHAFRHQERAVTPEDYVAAALRHPEVQRAVAARRWTGSWHTTFVTVDRKGGLPVDAAFEDRLARFLAPLHLAGHDVEVEGPMLVSLDVALHVCAEPGAFRAVVAAQLQEAFSARDLGGGRRGFFHPDLWTFGTPVHLSRIVAHVLAVPGVASVRAGDEGWASGDNMAGLRFRRWGKPPAQDADRTVLRMGPKEIARLDSDPNRPENGRIRVHVDGGI